MPELLAPAGSPEALDAAVASGADAVYFGLKDFNARMRSANFAYAQAEAAVKTLRRAGKKTYITVNTVFEHREGDRMWQLLSYLAKIGPDAIIVQDFGVLMMAREFPALRLHASTQMNIASARGANALSKAGVSRAVLARELSLEEIKSIRQNTNLELEVFIHGALCASVSGLCLFSSYLGGKSANRGCCTQACRRLYSADAEQGDAQLSGYFFSPCDLSLVGRAAELADAGVKSFKIEGRMKSAEYVGAVVSAYRLAIDAYEETKNDEGAARAEKLARAAEEARLILQNDFARAKTEYFFNAGIDNDDEASGQPEQNWLQSEQAGGTGISLGLILKTKGSGENRRALVKTDIALAAGDSVRLHKADDSRRETHKLKFAEADGGAGGVFISIPDGAHDKPSFDEGDAVYLIQTKAMTRRYPQILPKDLASFARRPGREKAKQPILPRPLFQANASGRKTRSADAAKNARGEKQSAALPAGVYAAVASVEDLYVLQSARPARAIVPLNSKTVSRLLGGGDPLPFGARDIVVNLDPFFPQALDEFYAEAIPALVESGYRAFILNNPGHFSFFPRSEKTLLIAGPWLYAFNGWAADFLLSLGADYAASPLENSRQNLEKTWPEVQRQRVFVTVFAWPPLFRLRADLSKHYRFKHFADSRGENFSLLSGGNAGLDSETVVIPETPFSIVDKIQFLEAAGFHHFIADFSGGAFRGAKHQLKKKDYKEVMSAAARGTPLAGISRFNWKDGFWEEKK